VSRSTGGAAAVEAVHQPGADHPAVAVFEPFHLRIGDEGRPVGLGAPRGGEREASVVDLAIPVARPAHEPPFPQHRLGPKERPLAQHPVRPHIPGPREQVVEPHPREEFPERYPVAPMDREDERQRMDEVRSDPAEHGPLVQRLEDEPEVAVLEISQTPVHQPARMRTGAGAEVAPFDQDDAEPTHRGVARDPRADDAAPDDEQVPRPRSEAGH